MLQALSSEVSDVYPAHFFFLRSTEPADPLLSMVKLMPVKVILQNTVHTSILDLETPEIQTLFSFLILLGIMEGA